jgi:hypothetical protein
MRHLCLHPRGREGKFYVMSLVLSGFIPPFRTLSKIPNALANKKKEMETQLPEN